MSPQNPVWESLSTQFTSISFLEQGSDICIKVPEVEIIAILAFLASNQKFQMDFLKYLTVVDWLERFEMVYHLYSYRTDLACFVSVDISREKPQIPSCQHIWPAANWHEREMFDLFGVDFIDHPNQQRLLLPPDWKGHPLRKDYQEEDHYQGVSTQRNYLVKLPSVQK